MEKKIIIFCSTTALALIAIVGLIILCDAAFSPKTAMASSSSNYTYTPTDFERMDSSRSADAYIDVQPVPEPATICMLGFGSVALVSQRKQRKNRKYKSKVSLNSKL